LRPPTDEDDGITDLTPTTEAVHATASPDNSVLGAYHQVLLCIFIATVFAIQVLIGAYALDQAKV
jgi:hypothetical protein